MPQSIWAAAPFSVIELLNAGAVPSAASDAVQHCSFGFIAANELTVPVLLWVGLDGVAQPRPGFARGGAASAYLAESARTHRNVGVRALHDPFAAARNREPDGWGYPEFLVLAAVSCMGFDQKDVSDEGAPGVMFRCESRFRFR